jgi:hypothetical protein
MPSCTPSDPNGSDAESKKWMETSITRGRHNSHQRISAIRKPQRSQLVFLLFSIESTSFANQRRNGSATPHAGSLSTGLQALCDVRDVEQRKIDAPLSSSFGAALPVQHLTFLITADSARSACQHRGVSAIGPAALLLAGVSLVSSAIFSASP